MILVAGLAVAGLAGIAAAFYFSMRPGRSRVRAAGPGRAADSRVPAGRSKTSPLPSGQSAGSRGGRATEHTGASTVIDFTGPQPVLDDAEPPVTGRRARHGDRLDDMPGTPVAPVPRRRAAARNLADADPDETEAEDAVRTTRSRRRVGWRKGSDVDEELWPAESFGGVSDEQFWDDLAADKPLATTARTAQPETTARRRPPNSGPLPDLHPVESRSRDDSRRATGAGTHPQPRLGPDDRTAIQPAAQPPAGSRGRSRPAISADEDPLTSPAYSLRAKGSVDGRSRLPDRGREQYNAAVAQDTQAFSLADTQAASGGYPDRVPPFRQVDRPAHSANGRGRPDGYRPDGYRSDAVRSDAVRSDPLRTDPLRTDPLRSDPLRPGDGSGATGAYPYPQPQPYGEPTLSARTPPYVERYGYGAPTSQPNPAGDPRRPNGSRGPGQPGANGAGDGSWSSRPGYPPVNAHRGPYDPRSYDHRLTSPRGPRAH
jgi:hypothetical protein